MDNRTSIRRALAGFALAAVTAGICVSTSPVAKDAVSELLNPKSGTGITHHQDGRTWAAGTILPAPNKACYGKLNGYGC